jgi:membrane-associated phospholipid phosphatase
MPALAEARLCSSLPELGSALPERFSPWSRRCRAVRRAGTLLLTLLVTARFASAAEPAPITSVPVAAKASDRALHWNPAWRKFGPWDYAVTGVAGSLALGATLIGPDTEHVYRGALPLDEEVRAVLRADSPAARSAAKTAADVSVAVLASYPVLVEGVFNAWLYRESPEVAGQLVLINLEAAAIAAALTGVTKSLASRERPYGRLCGTELNARSEDCVDDSRYVSFFSGHSSASFAAASVSCVQNQYVPLWGAQGRALPCLLGYGGAATIAGLRVVADRHYVSDVLVGAAVGTGVGLVVPWLHFRDAAPPEVSALERHQITLLPTLNGVALIGIF